MLRPDLDDTSSSTFVRAARWTAILGALVAALPIACGDDAANGGSGTTTSGASSGQGGAGFVPTTTVREVSLAGLDGGQASFDLSPTTLGALFWLRSATPYTLRLTRAEQTIVSQSQWIRGGEESILGVSSVNDILSSQWTLPSGHGDALPALDGTYSLTSMQSETASVATAAAAAGSTGGASGPPHFDPAVVRVREGVFTQGAIDFNVFLPAGLAPQEDYLRQVLGLVMSDFGGLSLGTVDFYTLSDDAMVLDTEEEAATLQKEMAVVQRSPSVSILVTTAFSPDGFSFGENLRGRSPLPGQPFVHGTPLDSLLFRISTDPAYDAIVVRHELGHYTGLYHTEEALLGITDALDDTSDCPAFPDSCNNPVTCGCDMQNLMFPVVIDGAPRTLSEKQRKMVQGSLVYRDDATVVAARRYTAPAPRIHAAWSGGLSPAAVAAVGGICGVSAAPVITPEDRRALLALAERDAVSPAIRRAAIEALGGTHTEDEGDRVLALAVSVDAPRDVRLGALTWIVRDDGDEARLVLQTLAADPDRVVRAVARATRGDAVD